MRTRAIYLSDSAVVIHYEEALYRVYGPFTLSVWTFTLIAGHTAVRLTWYQHSFPRIPGPSRPSSPPINNRRSSIDVTTQLRRRRREQCTSCQISRENRREIALPAERGWARRLIARKCIAPPRRGASARGRASDADVIRASSPAARTDHSPTPPAARRDAIHVQSIGSIPAVRRTIALRQSWAVHRGWSNQPATGFNRSHHFTLFFIFSFFKFLFISFQGSC